MIGAPCLTSQRIETTCPSQLLSVNTIQLNTGHSWTLFHVIDVAIAADEAAMNLSPCVVFMTD